MIGSQALELASNLAYDKVIATEGLAPNTNIDLLVTMGIMTHDDEEDSYQWTEKYQTIFNKEYDYFLSEIEEV